MPALPRFTSVTDAIADDYWSYVSSAGKVKTSRIIVGRPRPWPGDDQGDWVCPLFIEHVTPGVQTIAGVGPVDCLMNAVAVVQAFAGEIRDITPRANVPAGPGTAVKSRTVSKIRRRKR